MPNWVYNKLTVTGPKERLLKFSKDIGSKEKPFDYSKIATLVENSWDSRDERDFGEVKKVKDQLVYKFQTAWGYRPKLFQALSGIYKDLSFLIFYVEEGPAFVGATFFAKGKLTGEAFAEAGLELEEFFQRYDEDDLDSVEGEYDYEAMETSLVQNAKIGGRIDWKKREKEKQEREKKAKLSAVDLFIYDIKEIISNPVKFPPLAKKTNKAILDAVNQHTNRQTEKDIAIKLVPEKYWNDDLVATFLLANHENAKNLKEKYCTKKVINILLNDRMGYRGVWPLKKLKKGITDISQARKLIQKSATSLDLIPVELRTKEICLLSVTKARTEAVLKFVPKEMRDVKLCEIAVKGRGENLKFIPRKLKLQNICQLAVKNDPRSIQFVPSSKINDELMQTALNHEYTWLSIELDQVKNKSMRAKYLRNIVKKSHHSMRQMTNQEHELLWGSHDGGKLLAELIEEELSFNLDYLPIQFHNESVVSKVAKYHASANFEYLPDKFKTKKLCQEVVGSYIYQDCLGLILSKVPSKYMAQDLCRLALSNSNKILDELFERKLRLFIEEFIEPNFDKTKLESELKEIFAVAHIPSKIWDEELVRLALSKNKYAALFIPLKFVRKEVLNLLNESFYLFLVISSESQDELMIECVDILKKLVPETYWDKLTPWQSIKDETNNKKNLKDIFIQISIRWWKITFINGLLTSVRSIDDILMSEPKKLQCKLINLSKNIELNNDRTFSSPRELLKFCLMFDSKFFYYSYKIFLLANRDMRLKRSN